MQLTSYNAQTNRHFGDKLYVCTKLLRIYFLCNGMQEAHQEDAAPMDLERPLHYRRERKIDQQNSVPSALPSLLITSYAIPTNLPLFRL